MVHFCAAFICLLNDIGDERRHHEIYLSDPRKETNRVSFLKPQSTHDVSIPPFRRRLPRRHIQRGRQYRSPARAQKQPFTQSDLLAAGE